MGVGANNGCYFATADLTGATGLDYAGAENVGWGLWARYDPGEYYCVYYSSSEESLLLDGKWSASRAMAVIANICGGVTMIIAICLSCVSIPQMFLKLTAFLSFCAGFFQCLVFIYFSSDACRQFSCQFSRGAGLAVGAAIVYAINTCVLLKVPMYEGDDDDARFTPAAATRVNQAPPGSVQVTVEVMPDGTKKTVRTVVNADGSRTVTETIEHPAEETSAVPMATAIPTGAAEPAAKTY